MRSGAGAAGKAAATATILAAMLAMAGGSALAEQPRPYPKPFIMVAVPAASVSLKKRIPLPRPKPIQGSAFPTGSSDPQQTSSVSETGETLIRPDKPLDATNRGRLLVSVDRLGAERDPMAAADLKAGKGEDKWPETEVKAARERCNFVLAATNLDAEPMKPIGGPGGCGIAAPIKISAFGNIEVKPAAVLNCRLGATVYKWLTEVVQPAALKQFGEPIVALDNASSYSCRKRVNGFANARISEHSFGNALDIYGFTLASGRKLSVLNGWSTAGAFFGMNRQAVFLTKVHQGACSMFATVMGPRANVQHENHFHVDLGRGGIYKFCK